jgi:hypothetical protein
VAERVKVIYEGETVDAEDLGFTVESETTGSYLVSDGARVTIAHRVKNIYRLCDKKKPDGSPLYLLTGETVVKTDPKP